MKRMTLEEKVWQLTCISDDFPLGAGEFDSGGGDPLAKQVLEYGLGQIELGSFKKKAHENAEYCNSIQKKFLEQSRFGIPVIIHKGKIGSAAGVVHSEGVRITGEYVEREKDHRVCPSPDEENTKRIRDAVKVAKDFIFKRSL